MLRRRSATGAPAGTSATSFDFEKNTQAPEFPGSVNGRGGRTRNYSRFNMLAAALTIIVPQASR
jgi:hypothetical protein